MARLVQFEVELSDPIEKVAVNGAEVEGRTVLLTAPSAKHRKFATPLKQMFKRAIMEQQQSFSAEQIAAAKDEQKTESEEDQKIDGESFIMILESTSADMCEAYDRFCSLLCGDDKVEGCGSIEGTKLTQYLFDKLSMKDMEKLLGEYFANFLM